MLISFDFVGTSLILLLFVVSQCNADTEPSKSGFSGLTGMVLAKNPPTSVRNYRNAMLGRVEASIMGESALIDKETGRIFWEGGSSSTLSASIAPKLSEYGLNHFKATLLSGLLLVVLISYAASSIRQLISLKQSTPGPSTFLKNTILLIAQWTILRVPKMNRWLVGAILILYLIESYTCSTRRYLANSISSPQGLEDYIEQLRREPPSVVWKLRCFHYERFAIDQILRLVRSDSKVCEHGTATKPHPFLSPLIRKVVTHEATMNYQYNSCVDDTVAGIWARAKAATRPPPFTKILLSKLLLLSDRKTRMDYFKQQAEFFKAEGQRDEYAEFSTSIDVAGFRPRMLAVRYAATSPISQLFRHHLFWVFTFMGLTLPYRVWFARHCDVVRVTVVKETSSEKLRQATKGWFSGSSAPTNIASSATNEAPLPAPKSEFREIMQELELYAGQQVLELKSEAVVASIPSFNADEETQQSSEEEDQSTDTDAIDQQTIE